MESVRITQVDWGTMDFWLPAGASCQPDRSDDTSDGLCRRADAQSQRSVSHDTAQCARPAGVDLEVIVVDEASADDTARRHRERSPTRESE